MIPPGCSASCCKDFRCFPSKHLHYFSTLVIFVGKANPEGYVDPIFHDCWRHTPPYRMYNNDFVCPRHLILEYLLCRRRCHLSDVFEGEVAGFVFFRVEVDNFHFVSFIPLGLCVRVSDLVGVTRRRRVCFNDEDIHEDSI